MAAGYTEFYFTPVAWPDFSKAELEKAIEHIIIETEDMAGEGGVMMFWTRLGSSVVLVVLALIF